MSQASLANYFQTRKRTATDDGLNPKHNKVRILENAGGIPQDNVRQSGRKAKTLQRLVFDAPEETVTLAKLKKSTSKTQRVTRSKSAKPKDVAPVTPSKTICAFICKGLMSPNKRLRTTSPVKSNAANEATPTKASPIPRNVQIESENCLQLQRGMVTPVKQVKNSPRPSTSKAGELQKMSLDEVKQKLNMSSRMAELKTRLNTLQEGFTKADQLQREREAMMSPKKTVEVTKEVLGASPTLKKFSKMEVEILSPRKKGSTPTKPAEMTPQKNTLMSPIKNSPSTPQNMAPNTYRRLFSPTKSPRKAPAYQRYQHLIEVPKATLQLPYKYRFVLEMFRAVDTICATLFNRNEQITFKKLCPAVQRMMRKNFNESHLAQIKALLPDAFTFHIEKLRNFGSETRHETWQLVITPNVPKKTPKTGPVEENIIKSADDSSMSPATLLERYKEMESKLFDMVKDEHEKFLATLNPPMNVDRNKLTRWHPEFELDRCPEVKRAELPRPPQADKMSNAKDILGAARNLFNCATPMERALERLEEKKKNDDMAGIAPISAETSSPASDNLLKGVPTSLLAKIRQKQAAKALETMTRRPSADLEAANYSRLPKLAGHIRNVFITERKGTLPFENVIHKLGNSYKGGLTDKQLEEHMKLIEKEFPKFMSVVMVRGQKYLKFSKDQDLTEVQQKLEMLAKQKAA